jgi:hypothetical protein
MKKICVLLRKVGFDVEGSGCEAIEGTVAMVNEVLRELKSDAIVNEVMVDTADKARELKFLGSPSIRFNGRDIEAGADQRQDYGLG